MADIPRIKLVVANAINLISELNEIIVHNARNGEDAEITMPGMIERAHMIYHESGAVPMVDVDKNTESEQGA